LRKALSALHFIYDGKCGRFAFRVHSGVHL
jgi:hypothetical protein